MAPSEPFETWVQGFIAQAPNQRVSHADVVAAARNAGYRNFGQQLMNMSQNGQVRGETLIENNRGVLYYQNAQ